MKMYAHNAAVSSQSDTRLFFMHVLVNMHKHACMLTGLRDKERHCCSDP